MARMKTRALFVLPVLLILASCGSDDSGGGGGSSSGSPDQGPGPQCTDCTPTGPMTFKLPSPAGATLWTTPTMEKVLKEMTPPTNPGDTIQIRAAKNEFEPFQLVVHADADANVTLAMPAFTGPGSVPRIEVHRVGYVKISQPSDAASIKSGFVPDPLEPTTFGATEAVKGGENQPFWITVYVPPDAAPGDYTTKLTVTVNGQAQDVPVALHVFDFAIPKKLGFEGSWNIRFEDLGGSDSLARVEELKTWMFEHRLTPTSVDWPAGLNYDGGITYDCATGAFVPENSDYDFSRLGPKYISGTGWNGVGFPSFEALEFADDGSQPLPAKFCGVDRGSDTAGTPAFQAAWGKYLQAIEKTVVDNGWTDKAYYYVQNEPQSKADDDTAAKIAAFVKAAAPKLRTMISEQPKPEIAENPLAQGKGYDIWLADLSDFEEAYAKKRQALGESVWWYFLYGDTPPHFNPITIDHPGVETRIAFYAAWKHRIRGFYYFKVTGWGSDPYTNPRPEGTDQNGDGFLIYPPKNGKLVSSIRWELLREGVEDFEYLLMLAGGTMPKTSDEVTGCDSSVASAVRSVTDFTKDAAALQHLRDQLGYRLEKKVNGCPALEAAK